MWQSLARAQPIRVDFRARRGYRRRAVLAPFGLLKNRACFCTYFKRFNLVCPVAAHRAGSEVADKPEQAASGGFNVWMIRNGTVLAFLLRRKPKELSTTCSADLPRLQVIQKQRKRGTNTR